MANYRVGDLDVTISGVSKDAVSSLDEVIKQLDTLQKKLKVVSRGFGNVFNEVNNAAVRTLAQNFREITRDAENATNSQNDLNEETERGQRAQANAANTTKTLTEQIEEYQTKIAELSQTIAETKFGEVEPIPKNIDSLSATEQLEKYKKALKDLDTIKRQSTMTDKEIVVDNFNVENAVRRTEIAYYRYMLITGQAGKNTAIYRYELKQLIKEQDRADKIAGKMSKGSFGKLIKQIGKIALYRIIRRGLQLITQTFKESIQVYAQLDDNINETMSQITSSAKVMQLSLGTILFPLLQSMAPLVQQLSVGFANMANAINKSMALANNQATYTKINTDALQNYRKELNKTTSALFDFDKFRALSSKQDTASTFLSTEDVSELNKAESKYESIYTFVSGIGDILPKVLQLVGQIHKMTAPIIDVVFKIAGWLLKGVGYVLDFINNTGLIEPILYGVLTALVLIGATKIITWISSGAALKSISGLAKGIIAALEGVKGAFISWGIAIVAVMAAIKILSNWDDFSKGTKIAITVISALIAVLTAAAIAAMYFHGALTVGTAIPLILTAAAAGAVAIGGAIKGYEDKVPKYAVGASNIDGGSLFVAGEAGKTEMVYSGDNGKTNVANVQQMYQAEYAAVLQALKDYGAARGEMPQLQPASDTGIYQAANRGARKVGKTFGNV